MTVIDPATGSPVAGRTVRHTRRWLVAGSVGTGILAVAGIGIAFWSITGSGSGQGSVSQGSDQVSIELLIEDGLYPGASAEVAFEVTNPAGYDASIGTISLAAEDGIVTSASGCSADWFDFAPVAADADIPAGETVTLAATGSLEFTDSGTNQDDCKGATITLNVVSN
jgi:hypothetical protein